MRPIFLYLCSVFLLCLSACQTGKKPVVLTPASYPEGSHAAFRSSADWKGKRTYVNQELLAQTNAQNSRVMIVLDEQRAILFKSGNGVDEPEQVVIDTQVATGKSGHSTPAGVYEILAKKEDHRSNIYGDYVDETGKVVQSNVSVREDELPEGASFLGAKMPYWQRLTWDGIGMHVGYVPGRRAASHGCIRFPSSIMPSIFQRTRKGTPVSIVSSYEFPYEYKPAPPQAPGQNGGSAAATKKVALESAEKKKSKKKRWFSQKDVRTQRAEGEQELRERAQQTGGSNQLAVPPAPPARRR